MQTRMLYPRTFIITREEDTYVNATTCLPASTLGSAIAVLDEMLETVRHVGMGSPFAARGEWGALCGPGRMGPHTSAWASGQLEVAAGDVVEGVAWRAATPIAGP